MRPAPLARCARCGLQFITASMSTSPHVPLGLYGHVPFCSTTCDFCAFYQIAPKRGDIKNYLAGIRREVDLVPPGRRADTIFWGGGTPGLLPADDLRELGAHFLRAAGGPVKEWTIELAPSSVKRDKLEALRDMGVTRVSMGIQSFDEATLDALGRQHSRKQIYQAWELIREAGFASANLDLIFAIPGQDEERWTTDLAEAVRLAPDHLSTYCLTFEEDAALFVKLAKGQVKPDPVREAALYRRTWAFLADAGFAQYEVSNFSRPGHECIHNLNTWRMHEWLGYGPAAASQFAGRRFKNPSDLARWLDGLTSGAPVREDVVELSPRMLFLDVLTFGLRLNAGVDVAEAAARFGVQPPPALEKFLRDLEEEGLLVREGAAIRLTDDGRLLADAVAAGLPDFE